MEEKINAFVASAAFVKRDLDNWEKNGLPLDDIVQSMWKYFCRLVEEAKEAKIDTSEVVSAHIKLCEDAFQRVAPQLFE